ncbi:U-box domain-containing protein 16 [Magnolia sinica]|uniref:U-box domain-containing protein 16 n=1 Tax=Magnolia sinica TaxID=86752 RepID=UPI00265AE423|nr:U-box domain-containing protein 16 [Magnolia sinica]
MAITNPPPTSPRQLLQSLLILTNEISNSKKLLQSPPQKFNSSSILRKSNLLSLLFHDLLLLPPYLLPPSAILCLSELSHLLQSLNSLFDKISNTSKTWLLFHNSSLSNAFHHLNFDLSTVLDIFPLSSLPLSNDLCEQILLLKSQCSRSRPLVHPSDDHLRSHILALIEDIELGTAPDRSRLAAVFGTLKFDDSTSCGVEIKRLEDEIPNQVSSKSTATIVALVGLVRYGKCVLFGPSTPRSLPKLGFAVADAFFPVDFRCPISLDLMQDPVVVASGQTYDRASISRWFGSGHATCPKTGQVLPHSDLIPNLALKNLISSWCQERNIPFKTKPEENGAVVNKAAKEATRMTALFLVGKLAESPLTDAANRIVHELRALAKTGSENRASIAEAGAIPLLVPLLGSDDPKLQVNAVTALFNLSILEANKEAIMESNGAFDGLLGVLGSGATWEAKENAAATVLSLSAIHSYRKRFGKDSRVVGALVDLVKVGPTSSRRDAFAAILNLAGDRDTVGRFLEKGLVELALTEAEKEEAAEEALAMLAAIAKTGGAEALAATEGVVTKLMKVLMNGSDRGKEHAAAALVAVSQKGGRGVLEELACTPGIEKVLLELMASGTMTARAKAAALGRMRRRWMITRVIDPTVRFPSRTATLEA